jgi:agmatinase
VRTNPPQVAFLDLAVETDLAAIDADAAILGVPYGWPYRTAGPTLGCSEAPTAVRRRAHRLARFRDHWDFDQGAPMLPPALASRLVDAGDVAGVLSDGAGNAARITQAVRALLDRGAVPLCLGGDDSVTAPVIRAFDGHGPLTVLHVDAHLDFRDEVDGHREGYSSPMRRASEMDHVARIIQVGLRGVGSARASDVSDALAAGNLLVTAHDLRERGVGWVLEHIPTDATVFVAFDCDGLDPSVFPAVSALSPGGLSYAQADDLLAGVAERLAGAVFTEFVPERDVNDLSALVVARLLLRLPART